MIGSFESILEELSKRNILFIVVGGVAVNLHGIPRMTYDIDILLKMEDENLKKFCSLMKEKGYKPKVPVDIMDFADKKKRAEWINEKNMKAFNLFNPEAIVKEVDVLVDSPVKYENAEKNIKYIQSGDLIIPVIGIKDLIEMKKNTGRKQDESDMRYLKELLSYEEGI